MSEPMSEQSSEQRDDRSGQEGSLSVPDEALPEDLRPNEDNPLAQPAGDDVPDDVLKDTAGGGSGDDSSDDSGGESSGESGAHSAGARGSGGSDDDA